MTIQPGDSMLVELNVQNPLRYQDIPEREQLEAWVNLAYQGDSPCTVTLRIVDNTESQALNLQFRDKNRPTNILSFPFEAPPIPMDETHLGDLVACYPVIESEAREQHKKNHDHWAHLLIHGILHLQGYDHLSKEEANTMESLEIKFLDLLNISNPYI